MDTTSGRPTKTATSILATWLSFLIVTLPFLAAVDPSGLFQRYALQEQFLIVELSMAMCLVLWKQNASDGNQPVSLLNWWLGIIALTMGMWATVRYSDYGHGFATYWEEPVAIAVILTLLTLECVRRYAGLQMMCLILVFILYGFFGQYLGGWLSVPAVSGSSYATYLVFGGDALIGRALAIIVTIVSIFILLGGLFELAGATTFIKDLAVRLTSSSRGAPIKVAILSSGLIGSIIGSTTSNIMTSGHFSMPMMKKMGLRPNECAAIEAVASTGGQLTPPVMGFAAFLIIDIAGISYSTLIIATLLPSILFYFSLFVQADRMAAQRDNLQHPLASIVSNEQLIVGSIPIVVIFAALLIAFWSNPFAPEQAAAIGATVALVFGVSRIVKTQSSFKQILESITAAGRSAAGVIVIAAGIGIILGVINSTGLGVALAIAVSNAAAGSLLAGLLLAALASYILGMGLATVGVYVIVGTVVAPILIDLGITPIAAHLFVFYTAMLSMITPPVAIACVVASAMAGAQFLPTAWFAVRFGWIKFVLPFLFVYSPSLLLGNGTYLDSAITLSSMLVAIVLFTNATSGFEKARIPIATRVIYFLLALILLFPIVDPFVKSVMTLCLAAWIFRASILRQWRIFQRR